MEESALLKCVGEESVLEVGEEHDDVAEAVSLDMVSGGFSNAIEKEGLFGRGEAVMPSIGKDAGAAKTREDDRSPFFCSGAISWRPPLTL